MAARRGFGYAENATLPLGAYENFRGQAVGATSVLIAYTRTGDANLDGVVNDDDVTIVGANYAPGVPNANWAMGDFDYNGFVDDDDVTLLGAFYQPTAVAANYELLRTKDEIGTAAVPQRVSGGGFEAAPPWPAAKEQWPRASALTLPFRHDGGSSTKRRGIRETSASDLLGAVASRDSVADASAVTIARKVEQSAVRAGDQRSDDEILVDQLAESIAADAAGRGGGIVETRRALRRAVPEVMALWPA